MGVGGERHAPAALPPEKRTGTHCIGGWVDPRACLDWCGKSLPHRDSIPGPSRCTDWAIPAHIRSAVIISIYSYLSERTSTINL